MNQQEHNHHATPQDAHNHQPHHKAGHHHDFKGIDQWVARLDNPERDLRQLPQAVIAQLGLQTHDVVADIGAGTGYFALRIAEAYPQVKVIAADPEPEMIDYLRARATARGLSNLEPVHIDPAHPHLPVPANLVLMVNTLHHIDHRVEYLKFLGGNLAPGARIVVIDYARAALEGPPAEYRISAAEVVDELAQAGYGLVQEIELLPHQYFLIFRQAAGELR